MPRSQTQRCIPGQLRRGTLLARLCVPSLPHQVLVESKVLLALAPRLSVGLALRMWDNPAEPGGSLMQARQRQQRAAGLVKRLMGQLAQCSGLQELSISVESLALSLDLAVELITAQQLRKLTSLSVGHYEYGAASDSAAVAALAAALTARYGSRPDVAASRALHVTTSLVSEKGAMDVMQALGRIGVRGVRVVSRSRGFLNMDIYWRAVSWHS